MRYEESIGGVGVWEYGSMGVWEYGGVEVGENLPPYAYTPILPTPYSHTLYKRRVP
jgi:hypothetical protein